MIHTINIKGFQSLKDVTLDLGRVTVVTGDSDSGKSAIVRALSALALNRTSPAQFHNGVGPLSVEVVTEDHKASIQRPKGKSAYYELDNKTFTKVGREVPVEISNAICLREYNVDTDIKVFPSIQSQFGTQFLLQHPDSTVSKTIGRISNLNIVFAAMRKCSADLVALQQKQATLSVQIDQAKVKLKDFKDLELRQKAVALLSRLHSNIQDLAGTIANLQNILVEVKEVKAKLDRVANFEEATALLFSALELVEEATSQQADITTTRNRLEKLRFEHNNQVKNLKQDIEQLSGVQQQIKDLVENIDICPVTGQSMPEACRKLAND